MNGSEDNEIAKGMEFIEREINMMMIETFHLINMCEENIGIGNDESETSRIQENDRGGAHSSMKSSTDGPEIVRDTDVEGREGLWHRKLR